MGREAVRTALSALAAALAVAAPAGARVPLPPIPEGPDAAALPRLVGGPATPQPVASPDPPRHPWMAPNGRSNLHVDAFQTDVHQAPGPLGRDTARDSAFLASDCASVTFDAQGRIVTICVGLEGPKLLRMDPVTLDLLGEFPLPPRRPSTGSVFTDFAGGGYFYLDERDRAIVPTTHRHVWVVAPGGPTGFTLERDYDLERALSPTDKIISALPDWSGRIWFASVEGVVGWVDRDSGALHTRDLGERISNSFAVDDTGGVYIVTDAALYRFDAVRGAPKASWRVVYPNSGVMKPGQTSPGSGTTPTLMGRDLVAITDNADPMRVQVLQRGRQVERPRKVCSAPVFRKGQSATDNSLIGTESSIVVENNYGYTGPQSTQNGASTAPGVERVDVDRAARRCTKVWRSEERSPTVVPKLSAATGLVYVYTKEPRSDGVDAWYLTALDFRTGATVFKALGGEGLGYNNNYAPVTLADDGTAYVGVLGGLLRLADASG